MHQSTKTAHGFSLLTGMSQQSVHSINAMMRTTKRRRGEWIFLLGDAADSIYFVEKGRTKLTAVGEDGQEVLHEVIGPGDIFGVSSTILGIPRTTSAQALETSLLCEIRRRDLETLLSAYPEMSLLLLKSVGLRLKKTEAQLLNIICNDVSTRIREALINLVALETGTLPDYPVRIGLTQQDLANLIGASRQKTWQALKELEDARVLTLMYGSILVTAPNKLRNGHSPGRQSNFRARNFAA
jgi:CRP/FNR family transcriptional regulator